MCFLAFIVQLALTIIASLASAYVTTSRLFSLQNGCIPCFSLVRLQQNVIVSHADESCLQWNAKHSQIKLSVWTRIFLFVCALLWTCHNNLAHLGERWQIARWNGSQHDWAGKQGRTGRSLPLCTGAKPISSQPGRALVGDLCVTALRMLWVYSVYGRKETGFAAMMTFLFNTNVMLPLIFLAAIFTGAVSNTTVMWACCKNVYFFLLLLLVWLWIYAKG